MVGDMRWHPVVVVLRAVIVAILSGSNRGYIV